VSGFFLGSPIGDSHLRDQMQKIIDEQGLPDVVFHVFSALDILILEWGIGIPIKRLTRRYAVAIKWRYGNTWVDLALICTSI